MANILFIVPQRVVVRSICDQFVLAGHRLELAYNLEEAEVLLKEVPFDVLLLDSVFCGEGKGFDFIFKIKSEFSSTIVILSVCTEDQAIVYELLSVGFINSWIKDAFQNKELLCIVENLLHRFRPAGSFVLSSMQNLPERRKSQRKPAEGTIHWRGLEDIAQTRPTEAKVRPWLISYAKNISLTGLMLETEGNLTIHQQIVLKVNLAPSTRHIQADGRVKWVRRDIKQNKKLYGVQLVNITEQDLVELRNYLSTI